MDKRLQLFSQPTGFLQLQRPAVIIPGAELTVDSEQFLSLPELPDEVVIIGGGL